MNSGDDLMGQRFGRLTVIAECSRDTRGRRRWSCRCMCGEIRDDVLAFNLIKGRTTSCGCRRRDSARLRAKGLIAEVAEKNIPEKVEEKMFYGAATKERLSDAEKRIMRMSWRVA